MFTRNSWTASAAVLAFVLLWGSAALFTRWALDHGSVFAVLIARFALALGATSMISLRRGRWLPEVGTRRHVAATGLLLIGSYSICYFQAMACGLTPGMMSTLLGVQPILTLMLTERRCSSRRVAGLLLALSGLILVVYQSLFRAHVSVAGIGFAMGALCCVTVGTLMQKRLQQTPMEVLPLQHFVTLLLLICVAPSQPIRFEASVGFMLPVLWLGLMVSVTSQFLLYRMIRAGNLANITSLFYLVPVVTVLLDDLIFGNALPALALVGMTAILAGLFLVLRTQPANDVTQELRPNLDN
ncbi:MAG: EamA/RhaT family transporter [Myxococcaceae bacterium]|nr:EamA/RhaT family transporter [Myxococcaceae bacterium]